MAVQTALKPVDIDPKSRRCPCEYNFGKEREQRFYENSHKVSLNKQITTSMFITFDLYRYFLKNYLMKSIRVSAAWLLRVLHRIPRRCFGFCSIDVNPWRSMPFQNSSHLQYGRINKSVKQRSKLVNRTRMM